MSVASQVDPYLNRVIAGRYRLEERLGEGGMGVVYRARHVVIDRVVALKLIRNDLRSQPHLRAWLLREARAANRVDHAHIIDIHDLGETEEGEVYLVMEYLTGVPLSAAIAQGPLPLKRAVDIVEQIVAALGRAHDLGVIHRDLKADNLMITQQQGRKDFVKILDFGLAHLKTDPRLAPVGAVFGTPEYMSPEQARGEDPTAQSDLYALGVLFYEMLTGHLPFRSSDPDKVLEMQKSKPAPSVLGRRGDLPKAVDEMITRLMEKAQEKRYPDAHALSEDLKVLQRSLPREPFDLLGADTDPTPRPTSRAEWSTRAARVAGLVNRAYPVGHPPAEVAAALDEMWTAARRAGELEAETGQHVSRLESLERRSRALRAEVGRQVEELAREESRLRRDAAAEIDEIERLRVRVSIAEEGVAGAKANVEALEKRQTISNEMIMAAFERLGSAVAALDARREAVEEREARARMRDDQAAELRAQIERLKEQLTRTAEALEQELGREHDRVGARTDEERAIEKRFRDACGKLEQKLRAKPESGMFADAMKAEVEFTDLPTFVPKRGQR